MTARRGAYMVTVLWTSSDRFGQVWTVSDRFGHVRTGLDVFGQVWTGLDKSDQVWTTIFPQSWVARCPNLAHHQTCMQFSNHTSLETVRPFKVVKTAFRHASIGVRCELVWSATFLRRTTTTDVDRKLSIRQVRMWNFIRIGRQTKKLWLSKIPALRRSEQPGLGPPQRGVNCNFSSPELDKPYIVGKLSILDA